MLCNPCYVHKNKDNNVTIVSTHPGWSDTPGVEEAYGSQRVALQPM